MKNELPDYLKIGEGHIDITLTRPMTIDGGSVRALRMREPLVNDQLAMDAAKGSDADKEITLFSNLCEVSPDDIKKLTLRDYKRVQAAFGNFLI